MKNEKDLSVNTLSFDKLNINENIVKGLNDIGYSEPTPLQKSVIPVALEKNDIIVKARSGMGKNGSFIIPVLQQLAGNPDKEGTRALILTPEVEAAQKIDEMIWAIGYHAQIESAVVDMKGDQDEQATAVKEEPPVIVANPGRIESILSENHLVFKNIEILVVDDADKIEQIGIIPQVKKVLERVSGEPQTLFFSADFTDDIVELAKYQVKGEALYIGFDVFKDVDELEDVGMMGSDGKKSKNGQRSKEKSVPSGTSKEQNKGKKKEKSKDQKADKKAGKKELSHLKKIKQGYIHVPGRKKISTLMCHLENSPSDSVVIFTASKRGTDRLFKILRKNDENVTSIFGKLSNRKRDERLQGFKEGNYNYLLVADISANELGVDSVQQIINYDVPNEVEDYLSRTHLVKNNKKGQIVSLVSKQDRNDINDICKQVSPSPDEWKLPEEVKKKDEKKGKSGKRNKGRKKRPQKKQSRKGKSGKGNKKRDDELQLPQPKYDKLSGGRKGRKDKEEKDGGLFGFVKKLFD